MRQSLNSQKKSTSGRRMFPRPGARIARDWLLTNEEKTKTSNQTKSMFTMG